MWYGSFLSSWIFKVESIFQSIKYFLSLFRTFHILSSPFTVIWSLLQFRKHPNLIKGQSFHLSSRSHPISSFKVINPEISLSSTPSIPPSLLNYLHQHKIFLRFFHLFKKKRLPLKYNHISFLPFIAQLLEYVVSSFILTFSSAFFGSLSSARLLLTTTLNLLIPHHQWPLYYQILHELSPFLKLSYH